MIPPLQNVNVESTVALVPPADLKGRLPVTKTVAHTVQNAREIVKQILAGEDKRVMVVVGPCSVHDRDACFEYAQRLHELSTRVAEVLFLVMRVYFEKPRTTVGWKGLINDPHLNDTFDIQNGLTMAREFLLDVGELGLPAATEMLEPITPQYISDLITVASIGARTTESPTHRQMASGLSMPVGYKNGTDGSLQVALDAMFAAQTAHSFLGIDGDGKTCIVNTRGNPWGHLILRGGRSGPNYDAEHLAEAAAKLKTMNLSPRLVVDCSHANSKKDYTRQGGVFNNVIEQRVAGNESITGLMLESHLNPGRQNLTSDLTQLERGVSITDACIGWEETESLILGAYERLGAVRN